MSSYGKTYIRSIVIHIRGCHGHYCKIVLALENFNHDFADDRRDYLQQLIERGGVENLAEAIDSAIERLSQLENRERLERDTAAYFDNMAPEESTEEERLAAALSHAARGIDFDREP